MRTFVSEITPKLLADFLQQHGLAITSEALAAETPTEKVRAIEAVLQEASPSVRGGFQEDLDAVNDLASPAGAFAVSDVIVEIPDGLPSARARALWLRLNEKDAFVHATNILQANRRRGGRQLTAFEVKAGIDLARDKAAKARLEPELEKYACLPSPATLPTELTPGMAAG